MVRNLIMIAGLTLAVSAFGCSDDDTTNGGGTGGSAGEGGAGGSGTGGSAGEGGAGGGGAPVDQCDADDWAAMEGGEIDPLLVQACTIANLANCTTEGVNECLQDGNGGALTPTTLSEGCSSCLAETACCTFANCVPPCAGPPVEGDPCDLCLKEMCGARQDACTGAAP